MVIKVCEEGIAALNNAANCLSEGAGKIIQEVKLCESNLSEYNYIIHVDSLAEALEDIRITIGDASGPIEELAGILYSTAEDYRDLLDDDAFQKVLKR